MTAKRFQCVEKAAMLALLKLSYPYIIINYWKCLVYFPQRLYCCLIIHPSAQAPNVIMSFFTQVPDIRSHCEFLEDRAIVFAQCGSYVKPESYIEACMIKFCSCELSNSTRSECMERAQCSVASQYSRACVQKGVVLNWRTEGFCCKSISSIIERLSKSWIGFIYALCLLYYKRLLINVIYHDLEKDVICWRSIPSLSDYG